MQKLVDYVHPQVIAMTGQLFVASAKLFEASKSAVANEFGEKNGRFLKSHKPKPWYNAIQPKLCHLPIEA